MSVSKIATIGLAGAFGMGAPATAIYFKTKETILDQIKEDVLPISLEKEWTLLRKSLSNVQSIKDQELLDIKNNLSQESQQSNDSLKNWCKKAYSSIYKSIFQKENTSLLEDTKNACILTIKKKLGDKALDSQSNSQSTFESYLDILKDHEITGDSDLEKSLKELKTKVPSKDSNTWQKLKEWCDKVLEKGYKGDSDSLWKLADKFCKVKSQA